jgi:hypothetical protein
MAWIFTIEERFHEFAMAHREHDVESDRSADSLVRHFRDWAAGSDVEGASRLALIGRLA